MHAIGTRKFCIQIICEVQSHFQNLRKEFVWPEQSFGKDIWDLVARHNPDDVREIAVWRSPSYERGATCVHPQVFVQVWCGILESQTVSGGSSPHRSQAVRGIQLCRCLEAEPCARSFALSCPSCSNLTFRRRALPRHFPPPPPLLWKATAQQVRAPPH